jgi:hypothetical protein
MGINYQASRFILEDTGLSDENFIKVFKEINAEKIKGKTEEILMESQYISLRSCGSHF